MNSKILLRGGLVADGICAEAAPADVLIEGESIASVGTVEVLPGGCEVIELARQSVVCPGFIDAHAHAKGRCLRRGGPTARSPRE